MTDFELALEFLDKLQAEFAFKKVPTLNPMNIFLDYFNRPELSYKERVIVTGTAGKGTTCRGVEKILNENNVSTLTLYSPHIISALERVRVSSKLISKSLFSKLVLMVRDAQNDLGERISYYECLVLVGILAGRELNLDVLVCEVGLGGDFDATNAISGSRISAVTFIGLDHVNILGDSKELIAKKKLGIVTKNSKCFLTYEKDLREFFVDNCCVMPKFFNFKNFKNERLSMKICSEILGFEVSKVPKFDLPCRFERVCNNFYLDGAHSEPRILDLNNKISKISGKRVAIIGMVTGHDFEILKPILELFDDIIWTKIDFVRPFFEPLELVKYFGIGRVELNLDKIYSEILSNKDINYFVLGSFYLAGKFREKIISKDYIEETGNQFLE